MLEAIFCALMFMDYKQTLDIKNHPGYSEINPLLGAHPSDARVRNYFIGATVAYGAVSYLLPPEYRSAFQWGAIGLETAVVLHNHGIGLRMTF